MQATSKDFKIDHPLDPENKYLRHTSIESDDMKNVYDGVVTLNDNGEAWVQLPNWFQALNIDTGGVFIHSEKLRFHGPEPRQPDFLGF